MLEERRLDRIAFAELFETARRRIPGLTRGGWTDHNASDPGITLVELLAYLLEQRSYWADQVTPDLERALLRLLGVPPLRARAARTVLALRPATGRGHALVRAGRRFDVVPASDAPTFTLDEPVAALAHTRLAVTRTGRTPATVVLSPDDAAAGPRTLVLFGNDGAPGELAVDVDLAEPWRPRHAGWPVSLLLELAVAPGLLPQWHPDAAALPSPVDLEVWISTAAGLARLEGSEWSDGTGGLRRSGTLRIAMPARWAPAEGPARHRIVLRVPAASFPVPPRATAIRLNAAIATHQVTARVRVADSWPKLPGRTLRLDHPNGAPISGRVRVEIRELEHGRGTRWRTWREVPDLVGAQPGDRAFVLDGRDVRFGDGLAGRQPVLGAPERPGAPRLRVTFQAGAGERGAIRTGQPLLPSTRRAGASPRLEAEAAVDAIGARDDEALEDARRRAAGSHRRIARAVTADDHRVVAERVPGVGRAIAVAGRDERHPGEVVGEGGRSVLRAPGVVTVYLVPAAPRDEPASEWVEAVEVPAPLPDAGLLEAVREGLEAARLVGTRIRVAAPEYARVHVEASVRTAAPDAAPLRSRLAAALGSYLDPLVGGDRRDGWPLAAPIVPSALLRVAQERAGADAIVETLAIGVGAPARDAACDPVPIGCRHLPVLVSFTLRVAPLSGAGGLR